MAWGVRPDPSGDMTVASGLERPRPADDVTVHPPMEPDSPWIVQRGTQGYVRVGKDVGRLLEAMDGRRDYAALVEELGHPWSIETVERVVRNLSEKRLLDDGRPRGRKDSSWFKYVPPLTLQLTLLRPERLLTRVAPAVSAVANRWGRAAVVTCLAAGAVSLAAQASVLDDALGSPLPATVYLAVIVGFLASTTLHELAHGMTLVHYGGRPSRIGVMLFYLSPAFFCDVSDAWRLPRPGQRVKVALAGIAMQLFLAALASVAALVLSARPGATGARHGLLVFAVANTVAGALNLVPFVKLDGYLALMSHVDTPHLRARSIVDARRSIARAVFGGRYARELPTIRWAPAFGLASMAFPAFLVLTAMSMWLDLLTRTGVIGAAVLLVLLGYFVYHLGRGVARLVTEARSAGVRRLAVARGLLGLAAATTLVLTMVRMPHTVAGGYMVNADGAFLVLPTTAAHIDIPRGTKVVLARGGLVLHRRAGEGRVTSADAVETSAPVGAFAPVELGDDVRMPAWSYPLALSAEPGHPYGLAKAHLGTLPLGSWLLETYVRPAMP